MDRDIYNGKINFKKANEDQSRLLAEIMEFKENPKPENLGKNKRKNIFLTTFWR